MPAFEEPPVGDCDSKIEQPTCAIDAFLGNEILKNLFAMDDLLKEDFLEGESLQRLFSLDEQEPNLDDEDSILEGEVLPSLFCLETSEEPEEPVTTEEMNVPEPQETLTAEEKFEVEEEEPWIVDNEPPCAPGSLVWGIVPYEELPVNYNEGDVCDWIHRHPDNERARRFPICPS